MDIYESELFLRDDSEIAIFEVIYDTLKTQLDAIFLFTQRRKSDPEFVSKRKQLMHFLLENSETQQLDTCSEKIVIHITKLIYFMFFNRV